MDFLTDQKLIFTSERYASIYDHLREDYGIKLAELFLLAMTIGFHNNQRTKRNGRGREFRSNYFTTKERSAVYTMLLTDPEIGKAIDHFEEKDFQSQATKMMEEYAEGGMEILVDEVFMGNWDGNMLDKSYKEYEVDILSYISRLLDTTPF